MKKKTIVCFGDSNTHGYQSANNGRFTEEERWPLLLQEYLGEDYHICEEGLSGRTTVFDDPLFEGLNGLSAMFQCLMTHEPVDLLIIMLGTNDVKARFSATAPNIAKGMERLIEKAKAVHAGWRNGPNILLIAPPPIDPRYYDTLIGDEMGPGCAEKSKVLGKYYREVAGRQNCHYLDGGSISGMAMHPADYMHFDLNSHRLLAKELSGRIPALLQTSSERN